MKAIKNGMRPIHPGEVLREEFLVPMKLTAHGLAIALHVPAPRINDIVRERRAVSADTAMRLARFFNMSPEFWMGLQADYEMALARDQLAEELKSIRPFRPALAAWRPSVKAINDLGTGSSIASQDQGVDVLAEDQPIHDVASG
jgi:addiction module HigA family antidote